jgi:hypothetical protein
MDNTKLIKNIAKEVLAIVKKQGAYDKNQLRRLAIRARACGQAELGDKIDHIAESFFLDDSTPSLQMSEADAFRLAKCLNYIFTIAHE